jgi:D-alanyl-D-alanine carboxypeptidase
MQIYNTRRQRKGPEEIRIVEEDVTPEPPVSNDKSFLRRRSASIFIVLLAVIASGVFLYFANESTNRQVAKFESERIASDKAFEQKLVELHAQRIARAVEAETIARDNQPFDEKRYFPLMLEKNPGCDVINPASLTVVINKKHCTKDTKWKPANLVDVDGYLIREEAADPLRKMMTDATAAGVNFELVSTYRSIEDQQTIYDERAEAGSTGDVDSTSARAGYSEHHTGLAVDVKIADCALNCFGTTRRYAWLQANAANYGFIERYPNSLGEITGYVHEPWHWRYVGVETAKDMKAKGLQTLEAYFGVAGGDYYAS